MNLLNYYKENGLLKFFQLIVNKFLEKFFGLRIVRGDGISSNSLARKVFGRCKILYSDNSYYYLDPMPSVSDLNEYYSSLYWGSRSGKIYNVNKRDLIHYIILKEYIPDEIVKDKVFLNFGAGHGGISHLCWIDGMKIVNIEPSLLPKFYENRWEVFADINQVQDSSIDIIYGSHSLEHVQNIQNFKEEVNRVLKPNGYLFWEVPNADANGNGPKENKVHIPHTYYFQRDFFKNWFKEVLICDSYEQSQRFDVIENWQKYKDLNGSVIRALGKIN